MIFSFVGIRLAQWFLSLPFTSVDPGTNPTSYRSLACGLGFQSLPHCKGSPGLFLQYGRLNPLEFLSQKGN